MAYIPDVKATDFWGVYFPGPTLLHPVWTYVGRRGACE